MAKKYIISFKERNEEEKEARREKEFLEAVDYLYYGRGDSSDVYIQAWEELPQQTIVFPRMWWKTYHELISGTWYEYILEKTNMPDFIKLSKEDADRLNLELYGDETKVKEAKARISVSRAPIILDSLQQDKDVYREGDYLFMKLYNNEIIDSLIMKKLRKHKDDIIKAHKVALKINKKAERKYKRDAIKEGIKSTLDDFADFLDDYYVPIVVIGALAVAAGAVLIMEHVESQMIKPPVIEEYIEQNNNLSNFTIDAMTAIQKEDKYMLKIYGTLVETTEGNPVYSSMLYEIDEETYKLVNDSCDISYEFGAYNQVINAENSFKKDQYAVYRKVAEITKNQQPVEIEKYSPNEMATTSAQKFAPVEVEVSYTSEDGKVKHHKNYGGINVAMPEM